MSVLIKNGRIVTAVDDYYADIYIEGEKIVRIGKDLDQGADTVLDASGKPISGYAGDDAKVYKHVDELRLEPVWSRPLSELRGKTVRLRFGMRFADLYAFQVR